MPPTGLHSVYDLGGPLHSATVVIKEDVVDAINNIDPTDTPGYSTFSKTVAKYTSHDWIIASLSATATAGVEEGKDFVGGTRPGRSRLTNRTQIFEAPVIVSDTARAVDPFGVTDEYMLQTMYAQQEEVRNIEATIFKVASASATGDESTAGIMKGLRGFVGHATYNIRATAETSTIATAAIIGLHEDMFTLGAKPDSLWVSPGVKADLTRALVAAGGNFRLNLAAADNTMINNIEVFHSDFGILPIIIDRFIPQSSSISASAAWFLIERSKVRLAVLRPMHHVPMGKGGDHTRGNVITELTLELMHPYCVGVGTGVNT
jgi:hypothetical protein